MADLVIKGMALPKMICGEPGYVDVRIFSDGIVIMAKPAPPYYRKFETVPLPEGHGDLVERKALNLFPDYKDVRNRIKQTIKATERDGRNITGVTIDLLKQTLVALDSLRSVRRYFLNAKTIVPAEGGTDDVRCL